MQGQGSSIDTFPEITEVGLGSISNSTGMSQQTSLNNMLNPVETRLSSFMVTSGEMTCLNATSHDSQTLTGSGGPSSRLNLENPVDDDGMKMEQGWSSSYSACPVIGQNSEERRVEQNNILFPGRAISGNQIQGGPSFSQGSSSNYIPQNADLNAGYVGSSGNCEHGMEANAEPNLYKSSGLETEQTSSGSGSPDIVGTSSGSSDYVVGESDGNPGSSFGNWGSSCKRKALEGTSGQAYPGGSSSSFPQAENGAWNTGPARYNPSSNLSLSTPLRNSPSGSPSEQQNSRSRVGLRLGASDTFPSLGVTGNAESPLRQFFARGVCTGPQQESAPSNLSSQGRSTTVSATNSGGPQSQFPAMHMSGSSGNLLPLPWNGASSSRVGSLSSSLMSGYRGAELREEANLRSIPRNNVEHSTFATATDMRNSAQDPTGWSLAPGDISTSVGAPSSSRIGSSSGIRSLPNPAWIPLNNPPTENHQRVTEFSPWSLFPSSDSQPGGHSHYNPVPPRPSASSQDSGSSSGSNNQGRHLPYPRSAFLVDRQGDDVLNMPHSLRALAADIEGRRRLISEIRQVLNAMRRGENLRAEDYMLFDPFIYHGMPEMHDRHRDMRLDVDNMSYEELLALEERIGDVSTGLSEETIVKLMKQRKFFSITAESSVDMEPCCVCQEEYNDEDDIGTLDCGHDFHTKCIKQWLMQKNLCPICKTTALLT
ncbi:E3 ubiquitin-protein ligase MBR2 isoform X1 [Prunus avium]|uniref:RING-type E3 ubiquitin transferase n=1 Tax=Prunus avium TaxID=42229 RepID=A0A6P5TS22_PRUAV|nr:E3 ubiquitin-protein ligase MBR2 isoform X1 [Prunus avium]XP_021830484.1 E3 ubiquitin-protein ligase MBR2 isoform X1 [Prunus avium]